MINGPLKWYTVAEALRAAVHLALSNKPSRSCVVPGLVAWDECCEGQLAVTVVRTYLSDTFPDPMLSEMSMDCGPAWEVAEISIQILRCAPQPQGSDTAPDCTALDASAQEVYRDMSEVMTATALKLCQMERETFEIENQLITSQMMIGPEGGCVGSDLRALIGLPRG
jgi:hypothetical protein